MSSAWRSACLTISSSPMRRFCSSRASLTIRSASRLASASISWRSLTIQRACLISSGIVARIWSRMSKISSLSTRTWSVSGTGFALWTRSSSLSIRTRTSMAPFSSLPGEQLLQPRGHAPWDQLLDVPTERRQLLDAARAQETVLRAGHQVEGLDVRCLLAVELVHLQLVLEVGDRPQALHDRLGADLAREVDDERGEGLGADVGQVARRLLDERDALLDVEQRLALADRQVDHPDDDLIEDLRGPGDDIQVAVGDRVVGPGADGEAVVGR